MPLWLRQFTFNKIKEFYSEESEAAEKATRSTKGKNQSSEFIDFLNPDKSKLPAAF